MYTELEKSKVKVTSLTEIKSTDLSGAEAAMLSSLQGLIANQTGDRIFINCKRTDWSLQDLKEQHGVAVQKETDPWKLLVKYQQYIKGYILYSCDHSDYNPDEILEYDPKAEESINVANTIAPFHEAIIVDRNIEGKVKALGIPMLEDVSGKDSQWAYDAYWDKVNHDMVIEVFPQLKMFLRDYAYMTKSFVFHNRGGSGSLREKILSGLNTNGVLIGWSDAEDGEIGYISEASRQGIATIPSDWSANLTVFSSFPEWKGKQWKRNPVKKEENVHYVSILMSDGDNEQWVLNDLLTEKKWFNNQYKGQFDMAYAIPPYLYDHAPTLLQRLYENAANTQQGQDQFVVGPSGCAYMYPSLYPEDKLDAHMELLNTYMEKTDTHVVAVIDDKVFDRTDLWDKYTAQPQVTGLIYLDYFKHSNYAGQILFSNGKPIVSCTDLLWEGLTEDEEVVERVNNGSTDITSRDAYSLIYIHAWSKDMDDVARMVSKFNENVRIVNPEQFMELIQENVKK